MRENQVFFSFYFIILFCSFYLPAYTWLYIDLYIKNIYTHHLSLPRNGRKKYKIMLIVYWNDCILEENGSRIHIHTRIHMYVTHPFTDLYIWMECRYSGVCRRSTAYECECVCVCVGLRQRQKLGFQKIAWLSQQAFTS